MVDSLSLNNNRSWAIQTPQYQSVSNPWSYSLFNASPTVSYPENADSAYWDKQRFNFGSDATSLLNGSASLCSQLMPALQEWQAGIAKQFQEIMMKIQSGNGTTKVGGADETSSSSTGSTKKFKEGQIIATLNKMGGDSSIKDRFNKEITIKDKDGNEEKTTLLRRLVGLTKEYQESPDDCELSTANYRLIWDIAGKYAETGELTTEDYKILLDIAKNPGSSKADKEEKDDEKPNKIRPNSDKRTSEKITSITNDLIDGIENGGYWGSDKKKIAGALDPDKGINKDNIIEVLGSYKKKMLAYPNEKQDLISGILDDFGGWGDGDATGLTLFIGSDDAKTRLEGVRIALEERAKAFIKENGEDKGITNADLEAFVLPESRNDETIKSLFNSFIEKLKAAEEAVYKDEE